MEYLSLFDYLKKPAGSELGLKVAHEAQIQGIQIKTREISNPKYTGKDLTLSNSNYTVELNGLGYATTICDTHFTSGTHYFTLTLTKTWAWIGVTK